MSRDTFLLEFCIKKFIEGNLSIVESVQFKQWFVAADAPLNSPERENSVNIPTCMLL